MGWSRRSNVPDQDPNAGGNSNPLGDHMRLPGRGRQSTTEPLETDRTGSIFDQQTVVDNNFQGRSQARRQRQMGAPFNAQQLGAWAADPANSRRLMQGGAIALGLLLLLALFYVYNRSGNTAAVDDIALPSASADAGLGGPIIDGTASAAAAPDLGTGPQSVPAVPNTDPAQQQPAAGGPFQVTGTGTEGLFLRRDHVVDPGNILGTLPEGTRVQSLGEVFDDGTRRWQRVQTEQFGEGWVAADYLQAAQ